MTDEPIWVVRLAADAMHHELLVQHGGLSGIRDEGAIESALARPIQKFTYEPDADLARLGAAYGFGLAKNHGYNDGNKRVAFMVMYSFLDVNGLEIAASEGEVVVLMRAVASGEISEDELAAWLRHNTVRVT